MIYAETVKEQMDNIFKTFQAYIHMHDYFDILYSEKMGYVMLVRSDCKDIIVFPIDTPKSMIKMLLYAVVADVMDASENRTYYMDAIAQVMAEPEKNCQLIAKIWGTINSEDLAYLAFLEQYLKDYGEHYIED